MTTGIVFIITNQPDAKHKGIFESLCNKAIAQIQSTNKRKKKSFPTALISPSSKDEVKADIHIDAKPYLNKYLDRTTHGLTLAELLKTNICEWSPFDRTIYMDCDAFVFRDGIEHYVDVLSLGYKISVTTCVTMKWKDSIRDSGIQPKIMPNVPEYFPYWNLGVFGATPDSADFMGILREEYMKYCFGDRGRFLYGSDTAYHAQPALVNTAMRLSPDHKIFTMPAKYNAHFAAQGGFVFSEDPGPIVVHFWKDVRELIQ